MRQAAGDKQQQSSTRNYMQGPSGANNPALNLVHAANLNTYNNYPIHHLPSVVIDRSNFPYQKANQVQPGPTKTTQPTGVYVLESTFSQNNLSSPIVITSGISSGARFARNNTITHQTAESSTGSAAQQPKFFSPPAPATNLYFGTPGANPPRDPQTVVSNGKKGPAKPAAVDKPYLDPAQIMLNEIHNHN